MTIDDLYEILQVHPRAEPEVIQAAYDAAYLALAEAEKCDLWTGDKAFYQAVKGELPWVKWIGDYSGKE